MSNKSYIVLREDNTPVETFSSFSEAFFCVQISLPISKHWIIRRSDPPSTQRQRDAVHFCEEILGIPFRDNIMLKEDCNHFLKRFLWLAKQQYRELKCEFEAERGY